MVSLVTIGIRNGIRIPSKNLPNYPNYSISADAGTFLIDASTFVAEFFAASAFHVVTALRLLDPKLAEGALLELISFDKLFKCLVKLVRITIVLVLFARLVFVHWSSAI